MSIRETPRPRIAPHPPTESVDLAAAIRFARRNLLVILAPGAILAAATALFLLFLKAPSYEASTTLVVAPPAISSELAPATFSVHEYARLLGSDSLAATVRQSLQETNGWSSDRTADIDDTITVAIHGPNRRDATSTIALLEITARRPTPEAAAQLANTWARVLVETSKTVTWGTTAAAVELIEERYPLSEDRLDSLQEESLAVETDYETRQTALAERWEQRLAAAQKRHEEEIAAHRDETRELFQAVAENRGFWTPEQPGAAPGADGGHPGLDPAFRETLSSLLVARRQLAQTLPYITLKRSLGNDALSEVISGGNVGIESLEAIAGGALTMSDQEPNALYAELELAASHLEMDLEGKATGQAPWVSEVVGELASLQRARSASLSQLLLVQTEEVNRLSRLRRTELSALQRERRAAREKVDRQIRTEASLFSELARHHQEAVLLEAQKDLEPLHLATAAIEPVAPVPPGVGLKSMLAGLVGMLLGLTLAVGRELGMG